MRRLSRERDALGGVSDQIGCPTQAGSIASVLLELARRYAAGAYLAWGLYHYSGVPACSWYDLGVEIFRQGAGAGLISRQPTLSPISTSQYRSEARRVGNECVRTCSFRWAPYHYKKKKTRQ